MPSSGSAGGAEPPARAPVELREDVPLKGSAGALGGAWRCCSSGPRLVLISFAALSACITVALLAQLYAGSAQLVPHGAVASAAAACSRAGGAALQAGGRALDAAAAAALCLAVLAPHTTSLDASGSLVYWEYRELRTKLPVLYEWDEVGVGWGAGPAGGERAPRLVAALAALHAALGALPWARVLDPAIQLAEEGFPVSEGLAAARGARGAPGAGATSTAPELARYLRSLQANTSAEWSQFWNSSALVRRMAAPQAQAGAWRVVVGGRGAYTTLLALQQALAPPPASPDDAQLRVVAALQAEGAGGAAGTAGGVASGLAVVDSRDTYVALVTGVSEPFGSGPATAAGWRRDEPRAPIDLAPAILYEPNVCGSRYVLGAESAAALAQASALLAAGGAGAGGAGAEGAAAAVERVRLVLRAGGAPPEPEGAGGPRAAVNLVLQRGDALTSHADSRSGGLAFRF